VHEITGSYQSLPEGKAEKPHKISVFQKLSERAKGKGHIYGPEGQGFESLTACQKSRRPIGLAGFLYPPLGFE